MRSNVLTKFFSDLKEYYNELVSIKKEIEHDLNNFPDGKVRISTTETKVQYYLRLDSTEKSGKYLPKSNKQLISRLLQKSYYESIFPLIKIEIHLLEKIISKFSITHQKINNFYLKFPEESRKLITPIWLSDEEYVENWLSETFITKGILDDATGYYTEQGERVRSKSELMIANTLYKHRIPYKYEAPLLLKNGNTIYPDFTILDIKNRKEVYWEHRGMMDNTSYVENSVLRIKQMMKSGIIIGENLIITEEFLRAPLKTEEIELCIRRFSQLH